MKLIKKGIKYLRNQEIDIRMRMFLFLEYAALFAGIIGTIVMLAFATAPIVMVPNFVLIFVCLIGLYFSHLKKYEFSAAIIVCGCAYIALPFMFFTSGGNHSGMPLWFLFGVIFICLMLKGRLRVVMSCIGITISMACMLIGYYKPNLVIPLQNKEAEFFDMLQSFALVSIIICICMYIYIFSYDEQRVLLMKQSAELKKLMYTDVLTGIANRHAYYDDSRQYMEGGFQENLVLVAMDVNGLKRVNDTKGHAAGDELIKDAALVMQDAYSKYGNIYRIGGDEFLAILSCEDGDAKKLDEVLDTVIRYTNEKKNSDISIASGAVSWNENREKNFFELEKMADATMYQNKSRYYRESGFDRRKR